MTRVSVCVATNRPAFAEWLAHSFKRLAWPDNAKELVIAYDSTGHDHATQAAMGSAFRDILGSGSRPRWKLHYVANNPSFEGKKLTAGMLFDFAMRHARGEYFAFRSDDSWWHPKSIAWLVEAARQTPEAPFVGYNDGWFTSMDGGCTYFRTEGPIVATSLFRYTVSNVAWGPASVASDTTWQRDVVRQKGPGTVVRPPQRRFPHHLWLCHGKNTNRRDYAFDVPLAKVVEPLPLEEQLDLSIRLADLSDALGAP